MGLEPWTRSSTGRASGAVARAFASLWAGYGRSAGPTRGPGGAAERGAGGAGGRRGLAPSENKLKIFLVMRLIPIYYDFTV
jgi:hypothetical protein